MAKRITNADIVVAIAESEARLNDRMTQLQRQLNTHREINHKPPPSTARVSSIAGAVALSVAGIIAGVRQAFGL